MKMNIQEALNMIFEEDNITSRQELDIWCETKVRKNYIIIWNQVIKYLNNYI